MVLSTDGRESARASERCWLVDSRSFPSSRFPWLFLSPNAPLFALPSVDLRSMPGRSPVEGSNERRRRLNMPLFFGVACCSSDSGSMTVGAVVMMAGAVESHTSAHSYTRPYHYRISTYAMGAPALLAPAGLHYGLRAPLPSRTAASLMHGGSA